MPTIRSAVAARLAALRAGDAPVDHRHLDVAQRGLPRQQVVLLEDEAELGAAYQGQVVVAQALRLHTIQAVSAARGRVQAAEQVHQRALAAAAVADDRDELAPLDVERHAAQRRHLDVAHVVDLAQIAHRDHVALIGSAARGDYVCVHPPKNPDIPLLREAPLLGSAMIAWPSSQAAQ